MKIELKNNILQPYGTSFAGTDAVFVYFHIAKKKRYKYYQINRISINNHVVHGNHMLQEQDIIRIFLVMEEDTIEPWYEDLEILFKDELLCIMSRPANLLVHSGGIEHTHTVYSLVKARYLLEGHNTCVHPLHRLDYGTSGTMIFCKAPFLQSLFDAMLKNKQVYREYETFARGYTTQKHCITTRGVARDRHDVRKTRISEHGRSIRTDISVKQNSMDFTWVRCRSYTGRAHQIRVHLVVMQHSLLNDPLYGIRGNRCPRFALRARRVDIPHPLPSDILRVECPFPWNLRQLLDQIRLGSL